MRRMAKIWEERGGFELTENILAMQARTIIRKEWLTQEELDEIRIRESEEQGREEEQIGGVSVEVIPAGVLERIYHGERRQTDYTEIMDEISDLQITRGATGTRKRDKNNKRKAANDERKATEH